MATAKFETPALKPFPVIPLVAEGAMAHSKPFVAPAKIQEAIGFPGELTEGWEQRAVARMGELLDKDGDPFVLPEKGGSKTARRPPPRRDPKLYEM